MTLCLTFTCYITEKRRIRLLFCPRCKVFSLQCDDYGSIINDHQKSNEHEYRCTHEKDLYVPAKVVYEKRSFHEPRCSGIRGTGFLVHKGHFRVNVPSNPKD